MMKKRSITLLFILVFIYGVSPGQNNLRLLSTTGEVFKVKMAGKEINKIAEASILIEDLKQDTLQLTITFENKKESIVTFYLLDKGKKTNQEEYNYKISPGNNAVNVTFAGINEIVPLPKQLVPKISPDK